MADTPLSSFTPGNYSAYTDQTHGSDDEESGSFVTGSAYTASTPYGLATPATPYNTNKYEMDALKNEDDKSFKMNQPQIDIVDIKPDSITITLSNCDLSFVNALRRVCIAEVPTLAFDYVEIFEIPQCSMMSS
jgi:hypothetical protein